MNKKIKLLIIATLLAFMSLAGNCKMTKEAHNLYRMATACEQKEDYPGAIKYLQKAIEVNGDDSVLFTKIAGVYSSMGDNLNALTFYKKALVLNPSDGFVYVSMGNILQNIGDYNNAYEAYKQAAALCPEYPYNYLNLANIENLQKKYSPSINDYNKFLTLYPDNQQARESLARTYLADNKITEACNQFDTAYMKAPNDFKDYNNYGFALFKAKKFEKAIDILNKSIELEPENVKSYAELALSYQALDKNDLSEQAFIKTFELDSSLTDLRFDYGNLLAEMGKYDKAINEYKKYIEAYPDNAEAYKNLALAYKKTDNMDLATLAYEKAYAKNPNDIDTQKELAYCYHQKQDYTHALKFYDMALKANPDSYDLKYNKALALHANKSYSQAIDMYKSLLQQKDDDVIQKNLISALISQGYDLLSKNESSLAVLSFEEAVSYDEKEASAYFGLAQANQNLKNNQKANYYFEKAIELSPDNIEYKNAFQEYKDSLAIETQKNDKTSTITEHQQLINEGDSQYKKKNYRQAISCYSKAIIMQPKDTTTLLKLGNLYRLTSNLDKAIYYYQEAINLNGNYTDAWFNMGLFYATQMKYDKAINCFNRVITIDNNYAFAYYALGLAYEYNHDKTNAVSNYQKYTQFETDPKLIETVNNKIKQLEQ